MAKKQQKFVDPNFDLYEHINVLYLVNMRRRNTVKWRTSFVNSIRGSCRWFTNELDDTFCRKSPKADALWKLIDDHVKKVVAGKISPDSYPIGVTASFWDLISFRFHSLVRATKELQELDAHMTDLARLLPLADWVSGPECPGFSLLNYAILIGTVGNLSDYSKHTKLWKILSVAPIEKDGKVQAGSTWMMTGGLTSDDWKAAGYSPRRRSMVFNFGVRLIQHGGGAENPVAWSRYSRIYYQRKAYEKEKNPEVRPIVADRRARRVMEKRLLRDIWCRWRDAGVQPTPVEKAFDRQAA